MGFLSSFEEYRLNQSEKCFYELFSMFEEFIKKTARRWSLNKNLKILHGVEDIESEFKSKFLSVLQKFRYNSNKSEKENEKIFAGMLLVVMKNHAIDLEWKITRPGRQPVKQVISIEGDDDYKVQIADPDKLQKYEELVNGVRAHLCGDALTVFNSKIKGYTDTNITMIHGIKGKRIRELIDKEIKDAVESII